MYGKNDFLTRCRSENNFVVTIKIIMYNWICWKFFAALLIMIEFNSYIIILMIQQNSFSNLYLPKFRFYQQNLSFYMIFGKSNDDNERWCKYMGIVTVNTMLLVYSDDYIRHRFSVFRSVLVPFSRKPFRGMEGHDLGEPEDWYPAVAARSRRCLVSTSIAKQPEREIRPAIFRSPSLLSFLRFFSFVSSFFLPLFLCLSLAL